MVAKANIKFFRICFWIWICVSTMGLNKIHEFQWKTTHVFLSIYTSVIIFVFMSRPKSIYAIFMRSFFFIFIFIFIMINHIISWIQTYLFFCLLFRICPIILEKISLRVHWLNFLPILVWYCLWRCCLYQKVRISVILPFQQDFHMLKWSWRRDNTLYAPKTNTLYAPKKQTFLIFWYWRVFAFIRG